MPATHKNIVAASGIQDIAAIMPDNNTWLRYKLKFDNACKTSMAVVMPGIISVLIKFLQLYCS